MSLRGIGQGWRFVVSRNWRGSFWSKCASHYVNVAWLVPWKGNWSHPNRSWIVFAERRSNFTNRLVGAKPWNNRMFCFPESVVRQRKTFPFSYWQVNDLTAVIRRYVSQSKGRKEGVIPPVKITRAVGLQVNCISQAVPTQPIAQVTSFSLPLISNWSSSKFFP